MALVSHQYNLLTFGGKTWKKIEEVRPDPTTFMYSGLYWSVSEELMNAQFNVGIFRYLKQWFKIVKAARRVVV